MKLATSFPEIVRYKPVSSHTAVGTLPLNQPLNGSQPSGATACHPPACFVGNC